MARLLLVLLLALPLTVQAQNRVRSSDIEGTTWQLVFDIDASDEDNAFARIALKAVAGLLDEVDVQLTFEEDNLLIVQTDAFGEDSDEDESEWTINRRGGLILGSTDPFDSEDTVWYRDGRDLIAYELTRDGKRGEHKDEIYLRRR